MADFDAGSIEGRLELDTDPFIRGLRQAKAQAAEFEKTTSASAKATIDVDDAAAKVSMAEDEAALSRIDGRTAEAKVRVDNSQASAALAALERHIDSAAGFYKANSAGGLSAGGGHGLAYLIGLAAALAPALGPATAAVGLFGTATIAAFGGAAVSMALWGKVATGVFEQIKEADKAGKTLTGSLGLLQDALHGLGDAWEDLQTKAGPGIAKALIPTFQTLEHLIPKLLPLINSISTGVGGALLPIDNLLKSKRFDHFIDLLGDNAVKDLPQVGRALAHILGGLMGVFTALNPLIQIGLPLVVRMTKEFEKWSHSGAGEFVQDTFDKIQKYGPLTIQMLHNLFGAIGSIVEGLAPLTGPALLFLNFLFKAIKDLDLTPLAKGVGDVIDALTPFLNIIGQLVNVLLPPLGVLLSTLANSFIGPLGDSLGSLLVPALQMVADTLELLAPYLGEFISSIADLVNPTGVGLLTQLIGGLFPIIDQLIPPVFNLALALEHAVDTFLEAVGPAAIPAFIGLLGVLAAVLIPVINGLAWFLEHDSVAVTIISLAIAVKAVVTAMAIWSAVTETIITLQAAYATAMLGSAAATEAGGLSLLIYRARMLGSIAATVAMMAVQLAIRGATLAWAAAQWVLNAALTANPIGLIVVAVAALVAGFIWAYKNVGWFHDAVDAVWGAMKVAGEWIGNVFVATWHGLGDAIGWVKDHAKLLLVLLGPFGLAILGVIAIVKHWSRITEVAKTAWNALIGWLRGVPGKITGIFKGAAGWLLDAGRAILRGLKDGLIWVWDHSVYGWLFNRKDKILSALGDVSRTLYNAGISLINGFWQGLKDKWGELAGWFDDKLHDLRDKLPFSPAKKGPFSGKGYTLYSGRALIQGFAEGMRGAMPDAQNAAEDAMASISGVFKRGVTGIVGSATLDVSMTRPADPGAMYAAAQAEATERLIGALDGLGDKFKDSSKEERDAMTDALSKAFSSAGTAQARTIITAVRKQ